MFKRAWGFMFGGGDDGDEDDKNRPRKLTPHEESVEVAKSRIENSEKKIRELEKKAAKERKAAQAYGVMTAQAKTQAQKQSLKKKGMAALKKAKMYEEHAANASGRNANFENMTLQTQSVVDAKDTIDGMKAMHATMKDLSVQINPDAVHDMMSEIEETMDEFADLTTTISTPLNGSIILDEVDMEDEFDAMMAEEENRIQEQADVATLRTMETLETAQRAPKVTPPIVQTQEEDTEFEKMTNRMLE